MENGVNSELVTSILDKIIVFNTGNKLHVKLQIHLAIGEVLEREYNNSGLAVGSNKPLYRTTNDYEIMRISKCPAYTMTKRALYEYEIIVA